MMNRYIWVTELRLSSCLVLLSIDKVWYGLHWAHVINPILLTYYQLIAKPGNKTATVLWPDPSWYLKTCGANFCGWMCLCVHGTCCIISVYNITIMKYNTLRHEQNGKHFADSIFRLHWSSLGRVQLQEVSICSGNGFRSDRWHMFICISDDPVHWCIYRADSRFVPSQWETVLLSNDASHWLGTNLESAVIYVPPSLNELKGEYLQQLWCCT